MKFKRVKNAFIVFLMSLSIVIGGLPSSNLIVWAGESYDEVIAIIHTNDVHGHIEVEPYVKGLADSLKASGDYALVLTVSAGDIYGGGEAVAGYYKGELIPQLVDMVYDVIVPGNNDFGADMDNREAYNLFLTSLYTHTKTICANSVLSKDIDLNVYAKEYKTKVGNPDFADMYDKVMLKEDGSLDFSKLNLPILKHGEYPYEQTIEFITSEGTKIGLFGLTVSGRPDQDENSTSIGSVDAAQASIDKLKSSGASVIVGIGHTGWKGEGSTEKADANDTNSWLLANSVTGMDAYIDGHSHSIIGEGKGCYVGDEQVFVNQAQSFGACIGLMKLYVKDGSVVKKEGEVFTNDEIESITPDEAVQKVVDADLSRVTADLDTPFSVTSYFLNAERISAKNNGGTIRGNETNLGDFVTDIIRLCASEKTGTDYDFMLFPGVAIRSSVEPGYITMNTLVSIFGLNATIGAKEYSASDILQLMKNTLSGGIYPDKESVAFQQMSGIKMTYEYSDGIGTPMTIKVGEDLIYDADNGGIIVDNSWTTKGLAVIMGEGADSEIIFNGSEELQEALSVYLSTHVSGVDYKIYSNVVAPDQRIVEVNSTYETATVDQPQLQKNTLKVKKRTSESNPYTVSSQNKTKIKISKVLNISGAIGNVKYKKVSGNSKITVNSKTGKITVKKGIKKGIYKIKIQVTAAGNGLHGKGTKKVMVYVKVE
ncbi:MAG: 5'-nucleotidase C-terminal domain-containing protein [Lachnospiraceae bacterium]|nr:5'-nucleotidase C-terminal domain-containing protein [Lachnospiraceae bacterium]